MRDLTLKAWANARNSSVGIIALAILVFLPGILWAGDKPHVEVWLINTRCASICGDWEQGKEQISYWRMDENQQWIAADRAAFAEGGGKDTPTIFLLHGNRTTADEAVEFAWPVYCWLNRQEASHTFRVAIWSWPSSRLCRRLRPDVQLKASYCDSQSYYLADCLRGMKSETPVSLVGYSFGARIIAGGLHLLGGGTLDGDHLPELAVTVKKPPERQIRAVLIAAALDCFALAPGQAYEKASSQTEEMLVTKNGCDDALRWYPRLYGRGGPQALGYVGPCCGSPGNIRLFEATNCVGKSHQWEGYIYCPSLFSVLPHYMYAD